MRGVRGALAVWSAREPRTLGDAAYAVYVLVLTAGIVGGPGVRAVWLAATGPAGRDVLTAPEVPALWAALTGLVWAGALALGAERGPALRPPFLAATLAGGDLSRLRAFGGPVLRATLGLVAVGALLPVLPTAALVDHGLASAADVARLAGAGAAAGLVTAGAWLAGQVLWAGAAGAGALVVGVASVLLATGSSWRWAPWATVGALWPVGAAVPVAAAVAGGAALALAAGVWLVVGPELLATPRIVGQAVRAQRAQSLVAAMELQASGEIYRAVPRTGRRWRAVGAVTGPGAVVVADVVGSARTPGRLLAGLGALAVAGAVVGLPVPGTALPAGAVVAAVLAYAGASALCDGVRHAAASRGGTAQHGFGDQTMLALHAVWPLVGGCLAATAGALVAAAAGSDVSLPLVALAVVAGTVGVRVADALKGPIPVDLLVPVVTPAGDVSVIGRLVWLADGPLLVLAVGAAAAAGVAGAGDGWMQAALAVVAVVVVVRARRH